MYDKDTLRVKRYVFKLRGRIGTFTHTSRAKRSLSLISTIIFLQHQALAKIWCHSKMFLKLCYALCLRCNFTLSILAEERLCFSFCQVGVGRQVHYGSPLFLSPFSYLLELILHFFVCTFMLQTHCRGNPKFNFHKYMIRALEDDFKKVVGIR